MNQKSKFAVMLVILSLVVLIGSSWGQDIKERMRDRLADIVELKTSGVVGENNQGYLEYLPGKSGKKEIVDSENADRRLVYQAIAKQEGIAVEHVGKRRAIQIGEKAKSGEWLQNEKGQWDQKK